MHSTVCKAFSIIGTLAFGQFANKSCTKRKLAWHKDASTKNGHYQCESSRQGVEGQGDHYESNAFPWFVKSLETFPTADVREQLLSILGRNHGMGIPSGDVSNQFDAYINETAAMTNTRGLGSPVDPLV